MAKDTVYTDEVVESVKGRYVEAVEAGADYAARTALVVDMADELGVSEASLRSKLVRENVYVAKESAKTAGQASKEDLVKAMEAMSGRKLKSFQNATRKDLQSFWDYLVEASATREVDAA